MLNHKRNGKKSKVDKCKVWKEVVDESRMIHMQMTEDSQRIAEKADDLIAFIERQRAA